MLVVLIIFMATAPMIARRAMKVDIPKVSKSDKAATEALAVALAGDRTLTLTGRAVTRDELKVLLSRAVTQKPEQAVTISADKALPYGEIAELLDTVRSAGIRKVGLEVRRK